jgi:hypothetical protein
MEPKENNMKTTKIILGIAIVTLATSVYGACTWQVQMSGNRISGLGDPINSQDIVTKKYVDAKVAVIKAALKERQRLVNIAPTDTVEAVSKAPIAPTILKAPIVPTIPIDILVEKEKQRLAKIAASKEKQFTAEVVEKEKELLATIARRILAKIAASKEKQIIVEIAAKAATTSIIKLQEIRASKRTTTRIAATATTTNITKLQEIRESKRK